MRFIIACTAFALCAVPALAAQDIMASTYGNTTISTGGPAEIHSHYRADHTFDMTGSAMGVTRTFKGTWALDHKGHLCRTFIGDLPSEMPSNPVCTDIAPHKIGDKWTLEVRGTTREVTLVKGIQ
ncbi:MAG TPA: hypothetical protein VGU69_01055 [Rhizomicrobium sp.]|nr:hypothetical protein [Rhizomicrobium sp.]